MKPDEHRRVDAFVDALVAGRRPPRFPASDEEAEALRAAVGLRAAAGEEPSAAFVDGLARQLRTAAGAVPDRPASPGRRRFLKAAGLAAAAAATGALGEHLLTPAASVPAKPAEPAPPATLVPDSGQWTSVARLADLQVGKPWRFTAGAIAGFLIRHADDHIDALSAVCTHQGCILTAVGQKLDCPCHGASFDLAGRVIEAEYSIPPLPNLQVRVNDGGVEVLTA